MDADGSNQQRLTHDGPDGVQTSGGASSTIRPNGRRSERRSLPEEREGGNATVWSMSPDGSGQHALTADSAQKIRLSWSPDGRGSCTRPQDGRRSLSRRAAALSAPNGYGPVVAGRLGIAYGTATACGRPMPTAQRQRISTLPPANPAGRRTGTSDVRRHAFYPSSATGSAFQHARTSSWSADGSRLRRLTGRRAELRSLLPIGAVPAWWPDGSRLFYTPANAPCT
jgi:hypothetical protein